MIKEVYKRMGIVVLILIGFLIALDFIPVKFAKVVNYRYNDDVDVSNLNNTDILTTYSRKTGNANYPWEACSPLNFVFKVTGNNPYQALSHKDFYYNKNWVIGIDFILNGEVSMIGKEDNVAEFNVFDWDIVYPIKRNSFRQYYVPKYYLTIYDFEWFKVKH